MQKYLRLISIIILVLLMLPVSGQDTNKVSKEVFIRSLKLFPSHEQVARWFFRRYGPTGEGNILRFAKDPRGWYVYEIKPHEPGFIYNKQQIWSLEELAYRKTNYRPAEDRQKAEEHYQSYMQQVQPRLYKIHPFYGYNGWDRDVIHNLKVYDNLPDTLTYGLARAYSNFALSAVRHQYEYSTSDHKPAGYEKINKERLGIFTENMDKALQTFKKLVKQNPDFKTITGPISIKYNNEIMFAWHTMLSVKEEKLAKKYINQVNYDDFTLGNARNFLISVSEDGIMFTYGDNDTYPVWYIQEKENVRPDVSLINLSLLNTPWYIAMLKEQMEENGKTGLISFTEEDFENDKMNVIYYINSKANNKVMPISEVVSFIASGDNLMEVSSENDIYYLPTNRFRLSVDRANALSSYELSDENKTALSDSLVWETQRSYLLRNELLILDILANNKWRYPIHYSMSGEFRYFMNLNDHIQLHGLSYKLVPVDPHPKHMALNGLYVNAPVSYQLFMNSISFDHLDGVHPSNSFAENMINNMRISSGSLASVLMGRNEKDSAMKLLTHINEKIPGNRFPHNIFSIPHAELYLQLGEKEKALEIITEAAEKQKEKISSLMPATSADPDNNMIRQELQMAENNMKQIIHLCERYELDNLETNYKDFMQSVKY